MNITINLLPDEIKTKKAQKKVNRVAILVSFVAICAVVGLTILLYTYHFTQKLNLDSTSAELEAKQKELKKYEGVSTSINQIAATLDYINTLDQKSLNWENFIKKFNNIVPAKTQISSFKISTLPDTIIDITGKAESRREAIKFYEKMKATDFFTDVTLKTLDKAADDNGQSSFSFSISAKILQETL